MNIQHYKDALYTTGQIKPNDIPVLVTDQGFTTIVNNRADGEEEGQPTSNEIAEACEQAGIAYVYLPMRSRDDITAATVAKRDEILKENADKKVLFFCRSGGRSEALLRYGNE